MYYNKYSVLQSIETFRRRQIFFQIKKSKIFRNLFSYFPKYYINGVGNFLKVFSQWGKLTTSMHFLTSLFLVIQRGKRARNSFMQFAHNLNPNSHSTFLNFTNVRLIIIREYMFCAFSFLKIHLCITPVITCQAGSILQSTFTIIISSW